MSAPHLQCSHNTCTAQPRGHTSCGRKNGMAHNGAYQTHPDMKTSWRFRTALHYCQCKFFRTFHSFQLTGARGNLYTKGNFFTRKFGYTKGNLSTQRDISHLHHHLKYRTGHLDHRAKSSSYYQKSGDKVSPSRT